MGWRERVPWWDASETNNNKVEEQVMSVELKKYLVASMVAAVVTGAAAVYADEAPAAEAPAAEKSWEASVGFDLWTEYIFRGVAIQDNNPMYNPSVSFSYKGFSAYYWGAYGDGPVAGEHYEENDYGVDYTLGLMNDKLSVTAGFVMYHYPDDSAETYEFYALASYDCFLSPSIAYYWDFDQIGASYMSLGISHSFDLGQYVKLKEPMSLGLDLSASLGIDFEYNSSDTQLNDILLGVSVPFQVTENFEVHAGLQVSIALSALNDIGQGNELIGNVGGSFSF
jgi:hypothetical protein